ncbi:hypothetical protein C161_18631 [Paenibacillus sp. FSL R5-192]|uniref:SUKH-3 domain-containing protein n=1 Tax=Paenibacillus sp. FSL R5-192 TaxID=1226754 RepID=UPI0003E28C19|nr:SUKH-3 domain-containing protein [Paenibacillus sp. FSL R5-192]ETT34837.1 hypothetical protein C161_18631 [Paenibacillus sp. FSL R5-192]
MTGTSQSSLLPYQQMIQLLQKASWYENRCVDISAYIEQCPTSADLFPAARSFLEEFWGIDEIIYFKYYSHISGEVLAESPWHEYEFHFIPNAEETLRCSTEMHSILKYADEDCYCLGLTGYYYSAVTAIGRSGKLYLLHDYDPNVHAFDNLIDSMIHELHMHKLVPHSLMGRNQKGNEI